MSIYLHFDRDAIAGYYLYADIDITGSSIDSNFTDSIGMYVGYYPRLKLHRQRYDGFQVVYDIGTSHEHHNWHYWPLCQSQ